MLCITATVLAKVIKSQVIGALQMNSGSRQKKTKQNKTQSTLYVGVGGRGCGKNFFLNWGVPAS